MRRDDVKDRSLLQDFFFKTFRNNIQLSGKTFFKPMNTL